MSTAKQAWTVGQLRRALADYPDDMPIVVDAVDARYPYEVIDEQIVVGIGVGTVDWGDGPQPDTLLGIECEVPSGLLRHRPGS